MLRIDSRAAAAYDVVEPFTLTENEKRLLSDGRSDHLRQFGAGRSGRETDHEIDFRIPAMPRGRPAGADGGVAFHLSSYPISNEAVPTIRGVPYYPNGKRPPRPERFEAYLGRAHAAEIVGPAEYARYLERPGSEDLLAGAAPEAFSTFGDLLSNIASDPKERERYWRLVEQFAKKARLHALLFHFERCPEFWADLSPSSELPPKLLEHLLGIKAQAQAHFDCEETRYYRFTAKPLEVTADEAGEYLQAVHQAGRSLQPVTFKSGPSGRMQYRMEIELPHSLSSAARRWVVLRFCAFLTSLGLMWTAAPHRPGDHGDKRNNHFHVVWNDRPARLMEVAADVSLRTKENPLGPPGSPTIMEWDFAVAVPGGHKKNAKRPTYPFRQKKIERVSQNSRRTGIKESGKLFTGWLRQCYADIVNEALRARGSRRRFDPKSFEERDLPWVATKHLGNEMAALEADGVPTALGVRNALTRWSGFSEQNCIPRTRRMMRAEKARGEAKARLANRPFGFDPGPIQEMIEALWRMILQIEQDRFDLRQIRLYKKQALSRALVAAKAPARPIRRTRAHRILVERRAVAARRHISAIESAFVTVAAGLEELKLDIARREGEVERLTQKIEAALSAPRHEHRQRAPQPPASRVEPRSHARDARPNGSVAATKLVGTGGREDVARSPEQGDALSRLQADASTSGRVAPTSDPFTPEERAVLTPLSRLVKKARQERWPVVERYGSLFLEAHPEGPPEVVLEELERLRAVQPGLVHIALRQVRGAQMQDERIRAHRQERRAPTVDAPVEALARANALAPLNANADREETADQPAPAAALPERPAATASPGVVTAINPPGHPSAAKLEMPLAQSAVTVAPVTAAADAVRPASADNVHSRSSAAKAAPELTMSTQEAARLSDVDAPSDLSVAVGANEVAEDATGRSQKTEAAPAAASLNTDGRQVPQDQNRDEAKRDDPRTEDASEAQGAAPPAPQKTPSLVAEWEAVMRRIERKGLKVKGRWGPNGATYRVDGLSPEMTRLIDTAPFANKTQLRLAQIWSDRAREATKKAAELVKRHRSTPGVISFRNDEVEFAGLAPEELGLLRKCSVFPVVKSLLEEIRTERADLTRLARLREHGQRDGYD